MWVTGLKEPTNCCFTLRVSEYTKSGVLMALIFGGGGGWRGGGCWWWVDFFVCFSVFVFVAVVTAVAPRETDATSAHMHFFGQPRILGSSVFRGRAGGTWRTNPFYTSDL